MKKILLVNEGFSDNLGDQAIKQSLKEFFKNKNYKVDFKHYSNPNLNKLIEYNYLNTTKSTNKLLQLRIKYRKNIFFNFFLIFRNHLKLIKWFLINRKRINKILIDGNYCAIVIGGGQLINSSYRISSNIFSIISYSWSEMARINKIPLFFVGIGVAGRFNKLEKYLYQKSLNTALSIWVRDEFSKKILLNDFSISSDIIPDVAFYLSQERDYVKESLALVGIYSFHEYSIKFDKEKISIEEYYKEWVAKVKYYINKNIEVKLFFTTKTDAIETEFFQNYLESQNILIDIVDSSSLKVLNRFFEKAEYVYSGRMHALILALKKGCKVDAFLISDKLMSFQKDYIDAGVDPLNLKEEIIHSLDKEFKR
jgi:polysaccharide pyruvyl transferase WcaK-like protein